MQDRKPSPSGEQRAWQGRLQRNAHWVALVGGLVPAVTAAIISVITAYRGEPEANRAYELLAPQINAQKTSLQIVLSRLSKIEGHYEGREIGRLEAQVDRLLRENTELKSRLLGPGPGVVKKTQSAACRAGFVLGQDKRCHRVRKTVATKVRATEHQLREKQEWLRQEKEKRRQLEQKVRVLKEQRGSAKPAPPTLKAVPKTLQEASH